MSIYYILLAMIFFHILDDFCLQSMWLVNGKQKSWWEKNAPDPMYRYDYLVGLLVHGFSWAFMVMIPMAWYLSWNIGAGFLVLLVLNAAIHAMVDDLKANRKMLNLIQDQLIHLLQITFIWWILGVL